MKILTFQQDVHKTNCTQCGRHRIVSFWLISKETFLDFLRLMKSTQTTIHSLKATKQYTTLNSPHNGEKIETI